jgi:hypothetical protein
MPYFALSAHAHLAKASILRSSGSISGEPAARHWLCKMRTWQGLEQDCFQLSLCPAVHLRAYITCRFFIHLQGNRITTFEPNCMPNLAYSRHDICAERY